MQHKVTTANSPSVRKQSPYITQRFVPYFDLCYFVLILNVNGSKMRGEIKQEKKMQYSFNFFLIIQRCPNK